MASEENHTSVYEDDDESEEEDLSILPQEDDDDEDDDDDVLEEEEDLNSGSSADHSHPISAATVTVAVPPPLTATTTTTVGAIPDPKRPRIEAPQISIIPEERKQQPQQQQQQQQPLDESRRLFQRLWTDEDEIKLLKGFLEYTTQRGSSQHHHHDTALFYDQIKSKLQLDFNKNQLVEKLRRLKKKYRNVVSRISSGKDFSFKSPHDQATFEISRKIWTNIGAPGGVPVAEDAGYDDEEPNSTPIPYPQINLNNNINHNNIDGVDGNSAEKKMQRSRKRSRVKIEEKPLSIEHGGVQPPVASSIPSLIEETVKSCLSPLFKELLNNAMNGPSGVRGFGGVGMLSPMTLSFGGSSTGVGNFFGGEIADEKWKKQQILELEVYSKRLELVQDQIKVALDELRSTGS